MVAIGDSAVLWSWLGVGLVSMALSALYSGLETGVYCLDPLKLQLRSESGGRLTAWLRTMLARRERLLVVLLIGNNVANYGTTAAAAILLTTMFDVGDQGGELLTAVLLTPVLFVVGEMVPKNLFQRFADTLVYRWLWLLRGSQILFRVIGLVAVVGTFTDWVARLGRRGAGPADVLGAREQLHAILRETAASGLLSGYQAQIAENVLNVGQVTVAQVMTPLRHAQMVPHDATAAQFRTRAVDSRHSRWPVYRSDRRDDIIGVLHVDEVLLAGDDHWNLDAHVREPLLLPGDTGAMPALARLQRSRQAIGIVVDAQDRAIGIVTLKDLVEEIVGELEAW